MFRITDYPKTAMTYMIEFVDTPFIDDSQQLIL